MWEATHTRNEVQEVELLINDIWHIGRCDILQQVFVGGGSGIVGTEYRIQEWE